MSSNTSLNSFGTFHIYQILSKVYKMKIII